MTSYDPEDDPRTFGVSGASGPIDTTADADSIHEDPDMRQDEDDDPASSANPDPWMETSQASSQAAACPREKPRPPKAA